MIYAFIPSKGKTTTVSDVSLLSHWEYSPLMLQQHKERQEAASKKEEQGQEQEQEHEHKKTSASAAEPLLAKGPIEEK